MCTCFLLYLFRVIPQFISNETSAYSYHRSSFLNSSRIDSTITNVAAVMTIRKVDIVHRMIDPLSSFGQVIPERRHTEGTPPVGDKLVTCACTLGASMKYNYI